MKIQSVKKQKITRIEDGIEKVYTDELSLKVTGADGIYYYVPPTEKNKDYRAILKWVAEGNVIEEAD